MLYVKTVALISSPCLNGAIAPQYTVVVLKCAWLRFCPYCLRRCSIMVDPGQTAFRSAYDHVLAEGQPVSPHRAKEQFQTESRSGVGSSDFMQANQTPEHAQPPAMSDDRFREMGITGRANREGPFSARLNHFSPLRSAATSDRLGSKFLVPG